MDCIDGLRQMPNNCIDLIVSDPPYQLSDTKYRGARQDNLDYDLSENSKKYGNKANPFCGKTVTKGFMGKEWDVLPEVETLKECLRVLKAGAFSFWLMTPRQDSQAEFIMRLKQAGFVIGFSPIYWAYLSGFPKAGNISKMIDKRFGVKGKVIGKKDSGYCVSISRIRKEQGYRPNLTKSTREVEITKPCSKEAKSFDGSYTGFQPKPAVEVIIVAMKPLSEKTYLDQAMKNRKGVTWLDDCRIPHDEDCSKISHRKANKHILELGFKKHDNEFPEYNKKGRFPANLLVSDNAIDDGNVRLSSGGKGEKSKGALGDNVYGDYNKKLGSHAGGLGDSGSLSRYFDLDKWFEERMPKEIKKTFPFLFVPKPSSSEKQKDLGNFYEIDNSDKYNHKFPETKADKNKNVHPTVKPIKLFSYLITLGSRENDIIFDPYIGSGTLGISARLTCRKFIGFEREKEYYEIALARIKKYKEQKKLFEFDEK